MTSPEDTPVRIGYLAPQFPGQTHAFFWREVCELENRGAAVDLVSTRRPQAGTVRHEWSAAAIARTTYLSSPGAAAVARESVISAMPALSSPRRPLPTGN